MNRLPPFLLLCGISLGSGLVGTAQPASAAEKRPVPAAQAPTPEQQRVIDAFARCLAASHRPEAKQLVLNRGAWNDPPVPSLRATKECVPAGTSLRGVKALQRTHRDTLLFAAADILVRDEFRAFDPAVIRLAQPLWSSNLVDILWPLEACRTCKPKQLEKVKEAKNRSSALLAPQIFGECVVRTDPAAAHKLMMTDIGSPYERSAMEALAPALRECVMQGSQVKSSRSLLRGITTLSYYRVAHAPRIEPSGAQK